MLIDFNFRHFQPSDELMAYVSERFHKLVKFGRKSVRAEVIFSSQKKTKRVDVHVRGARLDLHAKAESEDFFESIDLVSERLSTQMGRKRGRKRESRRNAV